MPSTSYQCKRGTDESEGNHIQLVFLEEGNSPKILKMMDGESGEQITSYPIAKNQISTSPSHSTLKYIAEGEKIIVK